MVHTFSFTYSDKTYYFVWDTESGSLHNVDRVAFLIVCRLYEVRALTKEEEAELDLLPEYEYDGIVSELKNLEAEGSLNAPCTTYAEKKRTGEIKAMCLNMCYDCNLRCKYCFADEGTYHTVSRAHMSAETGMAAIDWLIEKSGARHNLEVDFFGGEPLLCYDAVKKIVEYARGREKESGKVFSFTMTTNCLLLDEEKAKWLDENMYNVVLSLDGRKQVHNRMRPTANGRDVYDLIRKNALYMAKLRGKKSYYVRGTFTHENLDFAADVKAMVEAGFDSVSVEPVVTDIEGIAITKEDLPAIKEEYDKLARFYLDRYNEGREFTFFHYFIDLQTSPCMVKRLTGCGSGCEYVAVSPDGKIYPCHQFCEQEEYLMGDVWGGKGREGVEDFFATNIVTRKSECKNCFAKYYCSGGCAANNIKFGGGMDKVTPITCEMMKKRLENALFIEAYKLSGE